MVETNKTSHFGSTLASGLGVLGFLLSLVSLGWQMHVHEESLTEKALVRFSVAFLNNNKEIRLTKTAKHQADVQADASILKKNELSAEVINIGQRPLYIKQVRLIVPCPETGDSDSVTFQPEKGSRPGPLEPGAAILYKAGAWNFPEHPLFYTSEPFCVTVESNKGLVTQTNQLSYVTFLLKEPLKSQFIKQKPQTPSH